MRIFFFIPALSLAAVLPCFGHHSQTCKVGSLSLTMATGDKDRSEGTEGLELLEGVWMRSGAGLFYCQSHPHLGVAGLGSFYGSPAVRNYITYGNI